MEKVEITLSIDDEKLSALEFCLKKEKATVKGRWTRRWRSSMSRPSPHRCGSTWTAAPLPRPGPGVRRGPRQRIVPSPSGRTKRATHELPRHHPLAG